MEVCVWIDITKRLIKKPFMYHSRWKVTEALYHSRYMVFSSFPSADLHQIIRSGQTLTNEHVQYFSYQILRGAMTCRQSNLNTQWIKLKG